MNRNVKSWQQTNPDNFPLAPWMRSFLCDRRSDKKIFVALVYVARSLVAFYVKPWAKLILGGRGRWCDDTHYGYIAYYGELQQEELGNHKQRPKSQTWDLEPQKNAFGLVQNLANKFAVICTNPNFFAERQSVLILQICRRDFSELSDNFASIFSLSFSRTGSCSQRRQSQQMSLVVTESWSKGCSKCTLSAPLGPFSKLISIWWLIESAPSNLISLDSRESFLS